MRKIIPILLGGVIMVLSILGAGCGFTNKLGTNSGQKGQSSADHSDPGQSSGNEKKSYILPRDTVPAYTSVISKPGEAAYGKIICLKYNGEHNGTLLVTYEQFARTSDGVVFPIYRSKDEGRTWEHISNIPFPNIREKYYKKWQPHLYELPMKVGDMEKGTILLAGNSFNERKTELQLFKSTDLGETWEYMSTIVTGGSFEEGVWEPHLVVTDDGTLLCFFADETDNQNHSQKISFRMSKDGINWSESKEAVALSERHLRPGMPFVARIHDGSYVLAYEIVGEEGVPNYVSFSPDGINWGNVRKKGQWAFAREVYRHSWTNFGLGCSPVIAWSPVGKDERGTLVLSGMIMSAGVAIEGRTDYLVSYDGGNSWERIRHPIPYYSESKREAYSNGMTFSNDGKTLYAVNTIYENDEWKVVFAAVRMQEYKLDES